MQENEILSAILSRLSVRRFSGEKISEEQMETILRAAMAAPSSMNVQPWHFVVIDDEAVIDSIAREMPYAKMIKEAGCGIAVCGDTTPYGRINERTHEDNTLYWVQDASAASQNILLAAHALGLGAVWTGVFPIEDRVKAITRLLQLPEGIVPLNIIAVGTPLKTDGKAKDKWDEEKIHYNKF